MTIATLSNWIKTQFKAKGTDFKLRIVPSTKHLEHCDHIYNPEVSRYLFDRIKNTQIPSIVMPKRKGTILVMGIEKGVLKINAYNVIKGSHVGDFVDIKTVNKYGYYGMVLADRMCFTVEGLRRKLSNWSIQGKTGNYGYHELSPFASFTMELTDKELIWINERIQMNNVPGAERAPFHERCA